MGNETFEEFLLKSFGDGVYSRELRLSKEEARVVLGKFPQATVKKHTQAEGSDGKCWYEIHLPAPTQNVQHDLHSENQRLKQEVERLKKSLADVGVVY